MVADGTYDGYWEQQLHAWDLAAGSAIVLGAGGRLSKYDGSAADVTSRQMLATNGRIHDALVLALRHVEKA
jgi:myo-inositol-1(or 4)-monophosphatase